VRRGTAGAGWLKVLASTDSLVQGSRYALETTDFNPHLFIPQSDDE